MVGSAAMMMPSGELGCMLGVAGTAASGAGSYAGDVEAGAPNFGRKRRFPVSQDDDYCPDDVAARNVIYPRGASPPGARMSTALPLRPLRLPEKEECDGGGDLPPSQRRQATSTTTMTTKRRRVSLEEVQKELERLVIFSEEELEEVPRKKSVMATDGSPKKNGDNSLLLISEEKENAAPRRKYTPYAAGAEHKDDHGCSPRFFPFAADEEDSLGSPGSSCKEPAEEDVVRVNLLASGRFEASPKLPKSDGGGSLWEIESVTGAAGSPLRSCPSSGGGPTPPGGEEVACRAIVPYVDPKKACGYRGRRRLRACRSAGFRECQQSHSSISSSATSLSLAELASSLELSSSFLLPETMVGRRGGGAPQDGDTSRRRFEKEFPNFFPGPPALLEESTPPGSGLRCTALVLYRGCGAAKKPDQEEQQRAFAQKSPSFFSTPGGRTKKEEEPGKEQWMMELEESTPPQSFFPSNPCASWTWTGQPPLDTAEGGYGPSLWHRKITGPGLGCFWGAGSSPLGAGPHDGCPNGARAA